MSYTDIAYDRGWRDAFYGYDPYCPYRLGTSEYNAYWNGYEDGEWY